MWKLYVLQLAKHIFYNTCCPHLFCWPESMRECKPTNAECLCYSNGFSDILLFFSVLVLVSMFVVLVYISNTRLKSSVAFTLKWTCKYSAQLLVLINPQSMIFLQFERPSFIKKNTLTHTFKNTQNRGLVYFNIWASRYSSETKLLHSTYSCITECPKFYFY